MRSRLFIPLILVSLIVPTVCAAQEVTVVFSDPQAKIAYDNPVWSPDGRSLAFTAIPYQTTPNDTTGGNTGKDVYLGTLTGGSWKTKCLAKGADWPVWSPDGKQLAVNRGGLGILTLATGAVKVIASDRYDAEKKLISMRFPTNWATGGRYLLYGDFRDSAGLFAGVLDLKKGVTASTKVGPDGYWISSTKLVSASRGGAPDAPCGTLTLTDFAAGSSKVLLSGPVARSPFVPKGASYVLVWLSENAPKGEGLYRVDLKTCVVAKQIAMHAKEFHWSPNGKLFAFIADWSPRAGVEPLSCVYLGSTANWKFKIATKSALRADDPLHTHLAWSPGGGAFAYVTVDGSINILKPELK